MKGVSTVIATVLMLVITIALAGMAYGVISGWFTSSTQGIEVADSFCTSGTVTFVIRNIGTAAVTSLTCTQTSPTGDTCTFIGAPAINIQPGQTQTVTEACSTGGKSCIYRIAPPIGKTIEATVYCT
jgi:flagellin-like protein